MSPKECVLKRQGSFTASNPALLYASLPFSCTSTVQEQPVSRMVKLSQGFPQILLHPSQMSGMWNPPFIATVKSSSGVRSLDLWGQMASAGTVLGDSWPEDCSVRGRCVYICHVACKRGKPLLNLFFPLHFHRRNTEAYNLHSYICLCRERNMGLVSL